jgi:hypothetical protein
MFYAKLPFAFLILLAAAAAAPDADPKRDQDAPTEPTPVTLTFLRQRGGKPPMRFIDVKLEATNPRDHPIWLLMSAYADDKPLPEKGTFTSAEDQPFGGQEYDGAAKGGRGQAVEIHFRPSFRAFLLPAKATLTFERFTLESWSDVSEVAFWEASSLRVNDRTPLEKWLPYPTLSGEKVVIPAGTDWKNLDWDAAKLGSRTDYPKETVKTATAAVEKKWIVPIAGIRKGDEK